MTSRSWPRAAEVAAWRHVTPKTITRRAQQGRLPYRRTLVRALTYRPYPPPRRLEGAPVVARRTIWQIDMGDGTWAVCCMSCRLPLYRGPKLDAADRIYRNHLCEPVVPLGRRRKR